MKIFAIVFREFFSFIPRGCHKFFLSFQFLEENNPIEGGTWNLSELVFSIELSLYA